MNNTEARTYINAILKIKTSLSNEYIETSRVDLNLISNILSVNDGEVVHELSTIELYEIIEHLGGKPTNNIITFEGEPKERITEEEQEKLIRQLKELMFSNVGK